MILSKIKKKMSTILDWENKELFNSYFTKSIRSELVKIQHAYEEWVAEHPTLAGDFKEVLKWVTLYFSGKSINFRIVKFNQFSHLLQVTFRQWLLL